jgi:hypothetical protein
MAKARKREPINIELYQKAWGIGKRPGAKKKKQKPAARKKK